MVEPVWFRLQRGETEDFAASVPKNYPYYMDEESFNALEDDTSTYKFVGRRDFPDFLFAPIFMMSDRFQGIFEQLAPETAFKYLHFINDERKEELPSPLYWFPYLPACDALHKESVVVQGKAQQIVLKGEALEDNRIIHIHLPADDIWCFSLEAAECILRRSPVGISFEKVTVRQSHEI